MDPVDCPSRRGVLRTLAGIGVTTIAAGVLVACGSDADGTEGTGPQGTGTTGTGTGTEGPGAEGTGSDGTGTGTEGTAAEPSGGAVAEASVPLADVPVGEAVVVDALGSRFVVAQPAAGEVVAFSAACSHQGTPVESDGGLELRCPNHGSRFDAADGGAVLNGPASAPLTQVQARIEGDLVLLSA